MKIGVPKETKDGEKRVAISSDSTKKFVALGADVLIEAGAGLTASISDEELADAGAKIVSQRETLYGDSDMILKVVGPTVGNNGTLDELALIKPETVLVGFLNPYFEKQRFQAYAERGLTSFAVELIPRISRAQSMDALSSQSNIAGYKAVIDAAHSFGKILPMMMTAAGTLVPGKVVILGAGVAGLQAIATAHRLGAVVSAFDVRPAVKEQVESLGATFIEVENVSETNNETEGGYAREMNADYQKRQSEVIHETVKKQDICITTAQIPGKNAPILITEAMVKDMKPGSVIVDLATESGGNCELSEAGKVVTKFGVTIIGYDNYPSRVPSDTSMLYARNLYNFVAPMIDSESGGLAIDWEDEVIKSSLLTRDGSVISHG